MNRIEKINEPNNEPLKENKDDRENIKKRKKKNKILNKKNVLIFYFPIILSINFYYNYYNPSISKLKLAIKELEEKIDKLDDEIVKKKISIAFVHDHIYLNGIARLLVVLTELLAKTGKYNVYLINKEKTDYDFNYNKKVKRVIQTKDYESIKNFDEENDIDIYILNNVFSDSSQIYHSFGKKVIEIFHGVFLSNVFQDAAENYQTWNQISNYDSYVHVIPDDYYAYKNLGFNNTIFIPNVYTFNSDITSSSKLLYKNILMVGRVNDEIKGAKFGIKAMAEIVKEIPDAILTIIGMKLPQNLLDLIKELKIENNVVNPGFSLNVTEFYLNSSVLLVTSVTESFPMVMNEGKAHGLPIVSFNVDYCPCFQTGVITVEMFDYIAMAKETIKLLKDYNYRKKMGKESKRSLNDFITNNETIYMWDRLFNSLIDGEYNKFQREVENKYYNETLAKEHLEKQFQYGIDFNPKFRCYSFNDLINRDILNKIKPCEL